MTVGIERVPEASVSASRSSISVAMATFNGLPYVEEQLKSILSQSRPVQEVVICDDKSTDGTWDWLSTACAADSRIRLYQNPKQLGSTKNFERAIGLCHGDIIFLSDQDDIWLSEKVERLAAALQTKDAVLAMSNGQLVKEDGEDIGVTLWDANEIDQQIALGLQSTATFELLVRNRHFTGSALCFKATIKELVTPIPAGVWHDQWIALIASLIAPGQIKLLDEKLYCYRQHSGNQIGARLPTRIGLASSHSDGVAFLRKARKEIMSHEDIKTDVEFPIAAIQRVNWIIDHHPQILTTSSARHALEMLQRWLNHSTARCEFVEHRTPLRLAITRERLQAYSEFSRGVSTVIRDILIWLLYKGRSAKRNDSTDSS